jgi:hypothetical protein
MLSRESAATALEMAMLPAADLLVQDGVDRSQYVAFLEADLRSALCEPFKVRARVWLQGGSFERGSTSVEAYCVAHRSGTWLLYEPSSHRFLGAHGTSPLSLNAHGHYASPLASWAGAMKVGGT